MEMATVRHGTPTGPAVDNLEAFFGVPEEGTVIRWEDLEEILGLLRVSPRFRTVVSAWREKLLREHNVFLCAVGNGGGLLVAPPNARVDVAARKVAQGRRFVERGILLAVSTDHNRLDEDRTRVVANIASLNSAMLLLHASVQARSMPLPGGESLRQDRGYVSAVVGDPHKKPRPGAGPEGYVSAALGDPVEA